MCTCIGTIDLKIKKRAQLITSSTPVLSACVSACVRRDEGLKVVLCVVRGLRVGTIYEVRGEKKEHVQTRH